MPHVTYFWDEIEDNVVEEYDGDTGATIASFTTEPTMYGSVLSQDRSGEKHYFQFDGLGNTTEMTDSSGVVTDARRYSAFGETTASSGYTSTPVGFGGALGYWNSDHSLNIRQRVYSPIRSRWAQCDPISAPPFTTQYAFCLNWPTRFSDPSGMIAKRFDMVAKSFINGAGPIGTILPERPGVGPPLAYFWGFPLISMPWTATERLNFVAAKYLSSLPAFNEIPEFPPKDGRYRLYTRVDVTLSCCVKSTLPVVLSIRSDMDGGHEKTLTLPFVSLPFFPWGIPPITIDITGTINLAPLSITPLSSTQLAIEWRGWGAPNVFAEPLFQWIATRTSRNIWHMPAVVFECVSGTPVVVSSSIDVSSRYPSHKLWTNGVLVSQKPQNSLADLWTEHPVWPTFVR